MIGRFKICFIIKCLDRADQVSGYHQYNSHTLCHIQISYSFLLIRMYSQAFSKKVDFHTSIPLFRKPFNRESAFLSFLSFRSFIRRILFLQELI